MPGKSKIKYLSSLKIKKFRIANRQFIIEGDKIITDILKEGRIHFRQLLATEDWLTASSKLLTERAGEITETDLQDIRRISSMETPPEVLAVLDLPEITPDMKVLSRTWVIGLDTIQDPGNLGTIIRTADWFGIRHILCNEGCADCYNPKAVQASMGAVLRVMVCYADLPELFSSWSRDTEYHMYGTFTAGTPVYDLPPSNRGLIIFGNESRGISNELIPFINTRITIPPGNPGIAHVESLNVASAVAVVCSKISQF